MNQIALVCANFGGIDDFYAFPDHPGVDCFYYTDAPVRPAASPADVESWTRVIVPNYPRHDFSPRLRSRYFKEQIFRVTEVRDHRWLAWIDSSLQVRDARFLPLLADRLASVAPSDRMLVVPHPDRHTIREEYEFISTAIDQGNERLRRRYSSEKMPEQMAYFEERGWSLDAPLYCGGFWMLENTERFRGFLNDWWDQNLRFGMMDQLPLSVLLAHHGCAPQTFDVNILENKYWSFRDHRE